MQGKPEIRPFPFGRHLRYRACLLFESLNAGDLMFRATAMIFSMRLSSLAVAAGVAIGSSLASHAAVAAPVPFLAHEASYELSLLKTRRNPSIDGAVGRILYNFTGSVCEGYSTEFRQVQEIDTGEGHVNQSDMRSTSWESADGKSYRFHIETRANDKDAEIVDGLAERNASGAISVKLQQPTEKTLTLDSNVVFPTEQVQRIIEAARQGKQVLELSVYDGSDTGDKVYSTLSVIGQPISGDSKPATPDVATDSDALKSTPRWPVTVSYFDKAKQSDVSEQTPVYVMSFELYENGVSRSLVLDYNDFVLAGAISTFSAKDTKPCK